MDTALYKNLPFLVLVVIFVAVAVVLLLLIVPPAVAVVVVNCKAVVLQALQSSNEQSVQSFSR